MKVVLDDSNVVIPERIRQLADLVISGDRYADALEAAQQWAAASGAMSVHAFDQRETILGQATLALELDGQAGPLDTVLVPVGGGGLIAGIAAYFAGTVRVIGVEPDGWSWGGSRGPGQVTGWKHLAVIMG